MNPSDPRLAGHPAGSVSRRQKLAGWLVVFVVNKEEIFSQLVFDHDHNNDPKESRKAADALRLGESDRLGKTANKCTVEANGNIRMALDNGSMVISPESFDKMRPIQWSFGNHGYVVGAHLKKTERAHRFLMGAKKGDPAVDHIDGDPRNNTLSNLRWNVGKLNGQNRKVTNPLGVNGIYRFTNKKTGETRGFIVYWRESDEGKHRYFSTADYDHDPDLTKAAAISFRREMERDHYEDVRGGHQFLPPVPTRKRTRSASGIQGVSPIYHESGTICAWNAHIRRNGRYSSKLFSNVNFASPEAAKEAAAAWRLERESERPAKRQKVNASS